MNTLSVVVNAQDVEKDPSRVLASVKDIADEIVVINQGSVDKIAEITKKFGAKIYNHEKVEYVELARNFAISKATKDWILVLDPDEEITQGLSLSIQEILKNPKSDYYRIARKNMIFGKWMEHGRWWPDYNIRLFKKGTVSWNEIIHAVPMTLGTGADIELKEELAIIHHHYDSIEQFIERMNRYTTQQVVSKTKDGYKFSWKDLLIKPVNEFFSRFFLGEGYKDGLHGLALSLLQASSELVLYLKIWQKEKFLQQDIKLNEITKVLRKQERDSHYWQSDAVYKETGNFTDRVRRKLRI